MRTLKSAAEVNVRFGTESNLLDAPPRADTDIRFVDQISNVASKDLAMPNVIVRILPPFGTASIPESTPYGAVNRS